MADQVAPRQITRPPARRIVYVLIWLMALAAPVGSVAYLLYANLLTFRTTEPYTANYDGFYWDAAQLQIAYARFENQLLLYQSGADGDFSRLQLRYQLLQSKVHVMDGSTRLLTRQPALLHRQVGEIRELGQMLDSIGPQLESLSHDKSAANRVVIALREQWSAVNDLALSRRFADVADREAINHDFIDKRRMLFAGGILLVLLSTAATILLIVNGRRRSRLIMQQHAALEAEHQASRAAREASLAKDAFLGMISHELRTPLHAIVSSIELLGLTSHAEADRKVIKRLDTAARHLEAQMKDLTDYARLGAGKLELRHQRFEPRELLASIVDEHAHAAAVRGLTLDGTVGEAGSGASAMSGALGVRGVPAPAPVPPRAPRVVDSDPHRIRQIVNNLVSNAIRYTETGGVRVRFLLAPTELTIVVSDTGPGVAPAQIPLIFQEFTQLDGSRRRRFEGAGMGLAIVQGLVDLFGGTVDVQSEVGEGTTFTVNLPVLMVEGEAPPLQGRRAPVHGARPLVLIVDDNALIRESLSEMVTHMGYDAAAVGSADDALAWLETRRCDVVLLDLHMPERDGYAFVDEFVKRGEPAAGVPVISVSASVADPKLAASAQPFFESLLKPVHYEELRAGLQRALAAPKGAGPQTNDAAG